MSIDPITEAGKRYGFGDKPELDPEKMALETVNQQHKFSDTRTGGKPLKTSASASTRGNPANLTVFTVSEIMQGIPEYSSPQDTLQNYQTLLNTDTAIALNSDWDKQGISKYIKEGLLPPGAQGDLEALRTMDKLDPNATAAAAAAAGGTSGAAAGEVLLSDIQGHPKIPFIDPRFIADVQAGAISPNCLWVVKYLADNGITIYVTCGKTGHKQYTSDGNISDHWVGRAVDIRQVDGGGDLRGRDDNQPIYDLLAALHGSGVRQPSQVGGPGPNPPQKSGGTFWFTNAEHYNHFHIGFAQFAGPAPVPGSVSGVSPNTNEVGVVTPGPAPAVTTSKSAIEFVRVALTQVGDKFLTG